MNSGQIVGHKQSFHTGSVVARVDNDNLWYCWPVEIGLTVEPRRGKRRAEDRQARKRREIRRSRKVVGRIGTLNVGAMSGEERESLQI